MAVLGNHMVLFAHVQHMMQIRIRIHISAKLLPKCTLFAEQYVESISEGVADA